MEPETVRRWSETLPGDAAVIKGQMKIQTNLAQTVLTGTGNVTGAWTMTRLQWHLAHGGLPPPLCAMGVLSRAPGAASYPAS